MASTPSERFIVVPDVVARHLKLTPAAKLVYGTMLALSRKTGCCFASQDRIGARLNLTRETVCRCIEQLEAQRLIRPARVNDGDPVTLKGGRRGGRTPAWECLIQTRKAKPKLVSMPKAV